MILSIKDPTNYDNKKFKEEFYLTLCKFLHFSSTIPDLETLFGTVQNKQHYSMFLK